jgi:myo-inositol 2-dehydrogenase/D-chiro-inositol 1-dehydrogenase
MNQINLGIIGTGRIGQMHARNISHQISEGKILAISDIIEDAAKKVGEELNVPLITNDYQKILSNKDIDGVLICSSTDTHAQIISEAAEAGKHIFCEKPIALEMDKIEKALSTVEKTGVKLMVGFNRRFDPSFKKAKELIAKGEIGEPQLVRITSRDPEPPSLNYIKVSGGLFLDMMIHDFDMARYLTGKEINELMAFGECLIDPSIGEAGDVDTAIVTLKFENGVLGSIDNSRKSVYGYDQRIEVFGSKGCVMVGNKKPTEVVVKDAKAISTDKPLYFFIERYAKAYLTEIKEFISCIVEDKEPSVSGYDGKISVKLGYAAWESLKKRKVVKI